MNTISQKTAQQIVDTVKDVCGQNINFINEKGLITASTDPERIGTFHEGGLQVIRGGKALEVTEGGTYYGTQKGINIPIIHNGQIVAAVGISGEVETARKYGYLAQKITSILLRERDLDSIGNQRQNRLNYVIRSIISGETLTQAYINDFLREYQVDSEILYRTLLICSDEGHHFSDLSAAGQLITQLFDQTDSRLYTFNYPNEYILFLKEDTFRTQLPAIQKLAGSHRDILKAGLGSPQKLFRQSVSYRNAALAIRSLRPGQSFASYDDLDFDLVLGSLPDEVRAQFLQKTVRSLSEDDLQLLRVYFEENMSLQETSRRLFLHKNTLQYKLNRIFHLCGYNPRSFRDAVVLYSAVKLMS